MLVTGERVEGAAPSLGYSVFTPGTELRRAVAHETEEFAYVGVGHAASCGSTTRSCAFAQGEALHIPAGVWHAVVNTGDEDVVMVFGFPHPDYPPTERR